jgi:hypothetical protein
MYVERLRCDARVTPLNILIEQCQKLVVPAGSAQCGSFCRIMQLVSVLCIYLPTYLELTHPGLIVAMLIMYVRKGFKGTPLLDLPNSNNKVEVFK